MFSQKELTNADKVAKQLRYHPVKVFTWLIIIGITSAFVTLIFCYLATTAGTVWNHFRLPPIFHANTIIILASSYTVLQLRQANLRDDHIAFRQALITTAGLGLAFTAFQIVGWQELFHQGISFRHQISGTYLYLISGLHLAHLLVGVGFLLYYVYRTYMIEQDAYQSLIFDTDPVARLRVEMLCIYWHFVDGLWLFLYLSFMAALYVIPRSAEGWFTHPF